MPLFTNSIVAGQAHVSRPTKIYANSMKLVWSLVIESYTAYLASGINAQDNIAQEFWMLQLPTILVLVAHQEHLRFVEDFQDDPQDVSIFSLCVS